MKVGNSDLGLMEWRWG